MAVVGVVAPFTAGTLVKTGNVDVTNIAYLIVSAGVFLVGGLFLGRFLSPYYVAVVKNLKGDRC